MREKDEGTTKPNPIQPDWTHAQTFLEQCKTFVANNLTNSIYPTNSWKTWATFELFLLKLFRTVQTNKSCNFTSTNSYCETRKLYHCRQLFTSIIPTSQAKVPLPFVAQQVTPDEKFALRHFILRCRGSRILLAGAGGGESDLQFDPEGTNKLQFAPKMRCANSALKKAFFCSCAGNGPSSVGGGPDDDAHAQDKTRGCSTRQS